MKSLDRLVEYIAENQGDILVAVRTMPHTNHETEEGLAGGILALANAPIVADEEVF